MREVATKRGYRRRERGRGIPTAPPAAPGAARMGPMRLDLIDELEDFVGRGALWDDAELSALIARLEQESEINEDPIARLLSQPLRSVLVRMTMRNVPSRMADDVEGIVYPRLWKVMEAVRDGLPDG